MKLAVVSMMLLFVFAGVADSATKAKQNTKKQTARVRCQPGYMFERGKCIIIPEMENSSSKH